MPVRGGADRDELRREPRRSTRASTCARWMRPTRVRTPLMAQPGRSYIEPEPKGVVLIIAPWNYPLSMVMCAAGRRRRRRQLRRDEAVRDHDAHLGRAGRDPAALPRQRRVRGRRRRRARDDRAARAAVRPHPLHRQRARRAHRDDRGREAPDAGDAGTGWQEPVPDRQERRHRGRRLAHRLGQVHQRRADLRRARPRAGAPRGRARRSSTRWRAGSRSSTAKTRRRARTTAGSRASGTRRASRSCSKGSRIHPVAAWTWRSASSSRPSCSTRRRTRRS